MTRTLLAAAILAAASLTPASATPGACTASDPHRPITSDCTTWTWPALTDTERAKAGGKPLVIQWFVADTEPQRLIGRIEITADTTTATFAHPLDAGTLCQVDVQVPRYWNGKPIPGGHVWLRGGTYPCPKTPGPTASPSPTNPTPTGSPTWTPQPSPTASVTPSTSAPATGSTRPSSAPAAPRTPPASASPSRPTTSAASPGPRSASASSAELASTGTDTPWLLGTALALITAGGFLTRRRSARRH